MDIEFEFTPPKKNKQVFYEQQSAPAKNSKTPKKFHMIFQTPPKQNKHIQKSNLMRRNENPQSRKSNKTYKQYDSGFRCKSPIQMFSSGKKVSQFNLSRLQTDYVFVNYLGSGNFSKVGLYRSRLSEQLFAIKVAQLSLMSINEVQALGTLSILAQRSKNIIRYYHSWIENQHIYIVMQYCSHSLTVLFQQNIIQKKHIIQSELKQLLRQSLQGLKCMHQHNMVHLDIKPDNLLIKHKQIKISDLGLCRLTRIKKWTELDQGDSRYLAKEILNYHQGIDLKKADIYSLGITFLQAAILQQLPNNGQKWLHIRDYGVDFNSIPQLNQYSNPFKSIITQMIHPNWQLRPSCQQLIKNQYFQQKKSKRLSKFMNKVGGSSRKKQSSL